MTQPNLESLIHEAVASGAVRRIPAGERAIPLKRPKEADGKCAPEACWYGHQVFAKPFLDTMDGDFS